MPKKNNSATKPVPTSPKAPPQSAATAEVTTETVPATAPVKANPRTAKARKTAASFPSGQPSSAPDNATSDAKPAGSRAVLGKGAASEKARTVKPAKRATVKAIGSPKLPAYTHEDIALRAYFIAQNRQVHGLSGNAEQDWIEAEQQLVIETSSARKKR